MYPVTPFTVQSVNSSVTSASFAAIAVFTASSSASAATSIANALAAPDNAVLSAAYFSAAVFSSTGSGSSGVGVSGSGSSFEPPLGLSVGSVVGVSVEPPLVFPESSLDPLVVSVFSSVAVVVSVLELFEPPPEPLFPPTLLLAAACAVARSVMPLASATLYT